MPATRTEKASSSKNSTTKPSCHQSSTSGAVPGVQKLKASLRQTQRLLAKDTLAANVRVETERRLKSLQADLEYAETVKKERTIAVRYHKVKFFERQKVLRKINQVKRQLGDSSTSSEAQSQLFELRVDLNYILNYPKAKKYISLFPPEIRSGDSGIPVSKTGASREEARNTILNQMKSGVLPAEPELHMLDHGLRPRTSPARSKRLQNTTDRKKQKLPDIHDDGFFDGEG